MRRVWILTLPLMLSACAGGNNPTAADPASPPAPPAASARTPLAVFEPTVLHDVQVSMSPNDWADLQEFFQDDQYYAADVTIDGERVQQIGVRSRGEGSRSGIKPALKLDFNQFVKGQRFHGLKSIATKNLIQDVSMLRDPLAMSVFEAMGIAAPRYSFARLTVNGEYFGLYNLVEDIDEPFLVDRFGEDKGNLFNYEYGAGDDVIAWDFSDRGASPEDYIPAPLKPETNEDTLDGSAVVDFVQVANHASDASFLTEVSKYVDVDRFLTYVAVENAVAESDGWLGQQGMNNFFLYQYANTTKFVVVPWDKNTSFAAPQWPLMRNLQSNVLARRLVAIPAKMQMYKEQAARAASYVNARFLVPKLDQMYGLVRAAGLADTKKPYDNATFQAGVEGLRAVIAAREADILAQTK